MSEHTDTHPTLHRDREATGAPPGTGERWTPRRAGVVAGVALLLMSAAAVLANFVVVEGMVTPDDGAATAAEIAAREGTFRLGVVAWLLIAALDVVIAWALYIVFRPVSAAVSMLAAGFRLVYTAVLVVAVGQLLRALDVLTSDPAAAAMTADQVHAQALLELSAFGRIYDTGLLLFGVHLALLGHLALRSGVVPRIIGVLLVVAGAGYAVDTLSAVLALDLPVRVAMFTFLGELLLGLWLLVAGRRLTATATTRDGQVRRAL
jgi:hypothetical protein